jgi:L-threonylcarbamoyladenylate synthase
VRRLSPDEAVAALRRGDVVAVPTDTVYGVAARLEDATAVATLFSVKSRPSDVALPVLVESSRDVAALDVDWPAAAQLLAERFWPGALTLVVGAAPTLAARVGARSSIGLRAPHHAQLVVLIGQCGPLAVTSANQHGHAPCVSATDVLATTWGAPLAGVLDGGVCDGAVSTVVEVSADGWWVRRRGALALGELEAVLGPETPPRDN